MRPSLLRRAKSSLDFDCFQPGTAPPAPGVYRPIRLEVLKLVRITHVNEETAFEVAHDPETGNRVSRRVVSPQTRKETFDHVLDRKVAYVEPVPVPPAQEGKGQQEERRERTGLTAQDVAALSSKLAARLAEHGLKIDESFLNAGGIDEVALQTIPERKSPKRHETKIGMLMQKDDYGMLSAENFEQINELLQAMAAECEDAQSISGDEAKLEGNARQDKRKKDDRDVKELMRITKRIEKL